MAISAPNSSRGAADVFGTVVDQKLAVNVDVNNIFTPHQDEVLLNAMDGALPISEDTKGVAAQALLTAGTYGNIVVSENRNEAECIQTCCNAHYCLLNVRRLQLLLVTQQWSTS